VALLLLHLAFSAVLELGSEMASLSISCHFILFALRAPIDSFRFASCGCEAARHKPAAARSGWRSQGRAIRLQRLPEAPRLGGGCTAKSCCRMASARSHGPLAHSPAFAPQRAAMARLPLAEGRSSEQGALAPTALGHGLKALEPVALEWRSRVVYHAR
jgi:hypothetical protein